MKKTVVITGINGFVGKHLTRELFDNECIIYGIGMEDIDEKISPMVEKYYNVDLAKEWPDLPEIDAVIHLAGLAAVGPSFDRPQAYIDINSAIVTNMAEYYLRQNKKPRLVIISSGAIYDPHTPMPISEESPIAFTSPYTVSKILVENQATYYRSRGLDCVVMRPFNHIGPGQLPGFLLPDLAEKINSRSGSDDPISVGNLETKRDYTDVRDVVRAYRLVATHISPLMHDTYNVCSGKSRSGKEVLETLVAALGIATPQIMVDEKFLRPNDAPDITGSTSRLKQEFGWEPSVPFEQTVSDFVQSLT